MTNVMRGRGVRPTARETKLNCKHESNKNVSQLDFFFFACQFRKLAPSPLESLAPHPTLQAGHM